MSKLKGRERRTEAAPPGEPRRASEFFARRADRQSPQQMFGPFWRRGELALMFGAAGIGKSLLAVQIANALARGRAFGSISMPRGRNKVLYVDLCLSDRQFAERYSFWGPMRLMEDEMRVCSFSENLYRACPPAGTELCEWLRGHLAKHSFDAVIIDDLSALKKTHDGVRETMAAMRELKNICDTMQISILAVTSSEEPRAGRNVSESDLKRSAALCNVADGVFAIGRARSDGRCVFQTRSRNGRMEFPIENAAQARFGRARNGWPGFIFEKRIINPETIELICQIRGMREAGRTWRRIESEMKISKTRAVRLFQKWTPSMGGDEYIDDYLDEDEDLEWEDPYSFRESGRGVSIEDGMDAAPSGGEPPRFPAEGRGNPPLLGKEGSPEADERRRAYGPERVALSDLENEIDGGGENIFIQSRDIDTGKPKIWYKRDRRGNTVKFIMSHWGPTTTNLGPAAFL